MLTIAALTVQSWVLYAVATSLILSRIISRRLTLLSWKKLQADDWLMFFVLVPFTAGIVLANQAPTSQSMAGRKVKYVLEELQIVTAWLVKACLFVLYWRIFPVDSEAWKRRTLQSLSVFCCLSFLGVQLSLIAWCRPVDAYWNTTAIHSQCASYHGHTITTLILTVLNTTSVMLLPVPFIPTPRRLLLAILLLLGILVLAAGIISRVLLLSKSASLAYLNWYTTECSLSIILANLPFLTPLFVSTAPTHLRKISRSFRKSSHAFERWPRIQRESWAAYPLPSLHMNRSDSTASALSEKPSPTDTEETYSWGEPDSKYNGSGSQQDEHNNLAAVTPPTRRILITRMRESGGLAEMGTIHVSMDNTEG
ncbi:hypothetical protein T440DRAFT_394598 [Plenodomus tracheiphilus IPT5]|uniref:Rhodopsin domain-containing protein n=1 Tax=Plenodomus tracheiphilus IPT5 TaxID=1408161 RepID=A0A6A7BA81_9PLEO|nr:hypothetical protein T440DRAFT_394598 [Plenodomus tracheiphilus IPT5]